MNGYSGATARVRGRSRPRTRSPPGREWRSATRRCPPPQPRRGTPARRPPPSRASRAKYASPRGCAGCTSRRSRPCARGRARRRAVAGGAIRAIRHRPRMDALLGRHVSAQGRLAPRDLRATKPGTPAPRALTSLLSSSNHDERGIGFGAGPQRCWGTAAMTTRSPRFAAGARARRGAPAVGRGRGTEGVEGT